MSATRKSAAERRREIVEATLRLLAEVGEGRLSTQAIADQVGITQAGLFRHFPTKNDLWIAVLTEIERRARRSWIRASRECDPAVLRLRKILLSQLRLIENYPAIPILLFSQGRLAAEDAVHPIHMRIMTALRLRILEELTMAVEASEQRAQIDTLDLESLLMGTLQDCVLRWSLMGRKYDLIAEGDRLIRLQLRLFGLEAGAGSS
ncbi:TetR/AcrR family transcriptional regulator [Roseovarius sp. S4756]|uniref:TetR/AcrR family transcriptional regulator n=1 Tax=Roseovarius maritimus TaxID=3342637 RepID=UPI003726F0E6